MKAQLARPPMVLVQWEDATELDTTAWVHETDHAYRADAAIINSVGFLLHDDARGIVISSAWSEDGQMVGRREQVPRGMIRKVTRLRS